MNLGSWRMSAWVAAVLLAVAVLVSGCGPKPPLAPPAPPERDPCAVGPEAKALPARATPPIRIALNEEVDWRHAPVPVTDAERFVFRQCFETLVRVDCTGRVRPGLAEKWESSDGGRVWTFTLRPGARFWDGEQADAFAVARALQHMFGRETTLPREMRWIAGESVEALGARQLRLAFSNRYAGNPLIQYFAHPATAVIKTGAAGTAPVGTGPFRIDRAAAGGGIRLVPHRESSWNRTADNGGSSAGEGDGGTSSGAATPGDGGPVLRIRSAPGADPRDLLAEGADLVIARSHSFTDYAEQLPEFTVIPLPWDRIYVLLAPGNVGPDAEVPRLDEKELARLRDDLAAQGSASDARPAPGLVFDVTLSGDCRGFVAATRSAPPPPAKTRVVYPAGDADAELLAERVAALAIMNSPGLRDALPASYLAQGNVSPRTQGLARSEWQGALFRENEYGYVHPVRREVFDHCGILTQLRARVPWAVSGAGDRGPNLLPLVITRPVAALRRGLGGLRTDGDGTLLLDRAGWSDGELTP